MPTQEEVRDKVANWYADVDRQERFINGQVDETVVLRDGRQLKSMATLEKEARVEVAAANDAVAQAENLAQLTADNLSSLADALRQYDSDYVAPISADARGGMVLGVDLVRQGLLTGSSVYALLNYLFRDVLPATRGYSVDEGGRIPFYADARGGMVLGLDAAGVLDGSSTVGLKMLTVSDPRPMLAGGQRVVALAPADYPAIADWTGLLATGESRATGVGQTTVVSATQPYANLTFSGGPKAGKAGNSYGAINTNPGTSGIKPLVEDSLTGADGNGGQGETICSGMANGASAFGAKFLGINPANRIYFASTAGHGGYRLDQIAKGTPWYQDLLDHAREAKARASEAGKSFAIGALALQIGHNDSAQGTSYGDFLARLLAFADDASADLCAITGQSAPVHLLLTQLGARQIAEDTAPISRALLDASYQHPRIHLVAPTYQRPKGDGIHEIAPAYQAEGWDYGRAAHQLLNERRVPDRVHFLSATCQGTALAVRLFTPTLPLVLDTANLPATTQMGFAAKDNAGAIALSAIAVGADGTTLTMTLARAPGAGATLRYCMDYLAAGVNSQGGATGNLRDSTSDTYPEGGQAVPMFHWAPVDMLPIITIKEA